MPNKITYIDSGVNIDEGNKLVEYIKPLAKQTAQKNVIGGIGSFSGAFALPSGYKEPILLASVDGVGTKLLLAIQVNRLDGIGIDLVAMCVNDLICDFAMPLFFLDYYASGKLDAKSAACVIQSIVKGCLEAECSLIGGESAEMPGMYDKGHFDIAGFSVGIAEKSDIAKRAQIGDTLIALPSSGLHSNGYSLVRKILKMGNYNVEQKICKKPLIDILLEPTCIYVKIFKKLKPYIHALAHITGGGIIENLPRILQENQRAIIEKHKIPKHEIFNLILEHVDEKEAYRTFNMGAGMILAVDKANANKVTSISGGYIVGEIYEGEKGVELI